MGADEGRSSAKNLKQSHYLIAYADSLSGNPSRLTLTGMSEKDPSVVGSEPTQSGQNLNQIRQEGLHELLSVVRELVYDDVSIKEMCRLEGLDGREVLERQYNAYGEQFRRDTGASETAKLRSRSSEFPAQASRSMVLQSRSCGRDYWSLRSFRPARYLYCQVDRKPAPMAAVALVSFPLPLFLGGAIVFALRRFSESPAASAAVTAERLKSSLNEALRSLVVIPVIENLSSLRLTVPSEDIVQLTDAPSISSRMNLVAESKPDPIGTSLPAFGVTEVRPSDWRVAVVRVSRNY